MQPSLVKYRHPQLERTVNADAGKALLSKSKLVQKSFGSTDVTPEDLLDSILPPRQWSENGQLWTQHVSSTPATRADVLALDEELDRRLKQEGARDYGICPVRAHLYTQCFDEILRQISVACAERGFLLYRVRMEVTTMIRAYQKLYESSAAFGMRKALHVDDKKTSVSLRLKELREKKEQLMREEEMLQEYVAGLERNSQENIKKEEYEHSTMSTLLRRKSLKVKHELERLLSLAIQK